jgi:hypothetical protein
LLLEVAGPQSLLTLSALPHLTAGEQRVEGNGGEQSGTETTVTEGSGGERGGEGEEVELLEQ